MAVAPLLAAVYQVSPARAFLLGLTTGFIYFIGTLYWITRVMAVYGGLATPVAALINIALVMYLALFPAAFAAAMAVLTRGRDARTLMWAPVVWVTTELGRTYLLTGFPWVLLGYSQVTVLPVAQLASLVGVYGLSALVAAIGAAIAAGAVSRRPPIQSFAPLAMAFALVLIVAGWGSLRIARAQLTREGERVRVGLVQGNVEQADKEDARQFAPIFARYLQMTRQAIFQGASFIVWPESSTPFYFAEDREAAEQVRRIAREAHVSILLGSDEIERGHPAKYYNSAFLVRPDGSAGAAYRKMHLVPFGEYVPARPVFFFMSRLVEAVSDFSPGETATLLPVGSHPVSTSICYEVVYPNLVRRFVNDGAELLTTITNDAWFGPTSAPHQHFAQASMRAIENGRYLVRSANTGVSGIVDPYGRVTERSRLFEPAIIVSDARFLSGPTTYAQIGDVFAYACVAATAALLATARRSYRMKRL